MDKRRKKGPEHIGDILKDASKQWKKAKLQTEMDSARFENLEHLMKGTPFHMFFLYIEGDPEYIRVINLN